MIEGHLFRNQPTKEKELFGLLLYHYYAILK